MRKRVLIIGGVAGGASCAARLRRLDESAEIVVFEKGPFVSFANCGLPYYVGNAIQNEKNLLQATPQLFRKRFNIDIRVEHEVISIDRTRCEIEVKNLKDGEVLRERYDALVLSPGAQPIVPKLDGVNLRGIFTLRNIPDSRKIREWIEKNNVARALVIGAGFIGIEMTENLRERGMDVTLVELSNQVLPQFDLEIAAYMKERLEENGVKAILGDAVESFKTAGDGILARLSSGKSVTAGIVILSVGVKPETELASAAGIELNERGYIRVDDRMKSSDPKIWAVGDAVEVSDSIFGMKTSVPLAGPANRQGRIAADNIAGRDSRFRGVQGTAVVGAFGMTLALTGYTEKMLKKVSALDYESAWIHPFDHATYYPGATRIHMKMTFAKDGKILGVQAAGEKGVEKRIDVISAFIQKNGTIFDLEEAELCYAPQYGSAKDAVNMLGFISANLFRGDHPTLDWAKLEESLKNGAILIDVREPDEFSRGTIPEAKNIPLSVLRKKVNELPRDKELLILCKVGQRGYYATKFLNENGFNAKNLSGGYYTWLKLKG